MSSTTVRLLGYLTSNQRVNFYGVLNENDYFLCQNNGFICPNIRKTFNGWILYLRKLE
ncbi:MAG: hypothetical protein MJK14_10765 [Rivularia sp. ALOHA_DT_140]|nr:hypothetical protein [Rivularia sp. ALOHA_DT_140]